MKIPRIPTLKILETDRQLKELLTERGITDIKEQEEIIKIIIPSKRDLLEMSKNENTENTNI